MLRSWGVRILHLCWNLLFLSWLFRQIYPFIRCWLVQINREMLFELFVVPKLVHFQLLMIVFISIKHFLLQVKSLEHKKHSKVDSNKFSYLLGIVSPIIVTII